MPKRALVMSGGGAKGAFQLGAVDYLVNERGLEFDVISGVSVGSLNAVMLAQGKGLDGLKSQTAALKDLWFGIEGNGDVYKKRFLAELFIFLFNNSLYDPSPIADKINTQVNSGRLKESGREFRAGAVSLDSGKYKTVSQHDPSISAWVLASSSMPVFFPPVEIGSDHWVDGGVRNVTPLSESFHALKTLAPCSDVTTEENEMYVMLASPLPVEPAENTDWRTGLPVAERAVSILVNEIFLEDLSYALAINESVRAYQAMRQHLQSKGQLDDAAKAVLDTFPFKSPDYCPVTIRAIVPDRAFAQDLEFDPQRIRTAYNSGRDVAASGILSESELKKRLADLHH